MAYNSWKLMDKIDVAIKTSPVNEHWGRQFDGYIVEHGDKEGLKRAKDWARVRVWNRDKQEYDKVYEPEVHTFENKGFTARILNSAGGSSQGGRLSFLACEIEKDGVKFVVGVNDAILVDLLKSSDMSKGLIKQKVMFARKAGQPGFIHEEMEAYKEAVADMKQKSDLKKAKKTKKWELGGVYSTLTQKSICLGEVWDTLEPYEAVESHSSGYWQQFNRTVTKYRKAKEPRKTYAWVHFYDFRHEGLPTDFETFLKEELDSNYVHFSVGVPPSRTKETQLEVKESDMKLLDKLLSLKTEYDRYYSEEKVKGRYKRTVNG